MIRCQNHLCSWAIPYLPYLCQFVAVMIDFNNDWFPRVRPHLDFVSYLKIFDLNKSWILYLHFSIHMKALIIYWTIFAVGFVKCCVPTRLLVITDAISISNTATPPATLLDVLCRALATRGTICAGIKLVSRTVSRAFESILAAVGHSWILYNTLCIFGAIYTLWGDDPVQGEVLVADLVLTVWIRTAGPTECLI